MSISTVRVAGSSMRAVQRGIDLASHNIANVNTTAYKSKHASFQGVLGKTMSGPMAYNGATIASTNTNMSQGSIKRTGLATDLALSGNGFFLVQNATGEVMYTRDGSFTLDGNGDLTDANGNFVLSAGFDRISIPTTTQFIEINPAGEIRVQEQGSLTLTTLDQIQLATFVNPQGLQHIGGNVYTETVASGQAEFSTAISQGTKTSNTQIVSGGLEGSNLDLSNALVDLMALQRSYQAISKSATTGNDLVEETIALSR